MIKQWIAGFVALGSMAAMAEAPVEIVEVGSGGAVVSVSSITPITMKMDNEVSPANMVVEEPLPAISDVAPPSSPMVEENPMANLTTQVALLQDTMAQMTGKIEELEQKIELLKQVPAAPQKLTPEETLGAREKAVAAPPVAEPVAATPEEAYGLARAYITQADYPRAESALVEFIQLNPNHTLVPAAAYWAGEAAAAQKNYEGAAKHFLSGYQKDPKGPKAPDNLLKLAMSLESLGKKKEACLTLRKLFKEHGAKMTGSVKSVGEKAKKRLKCT